MTARILVGDVRTRLTEIPAGSVRCCVTSPPYFGLRDYGVAGQIGLESTPDAYVAEMVGVFRLVREALTEDGTLWLNLGDSYAGGGKGGNPPDSPHQKQRTNRGSLLHAGLHESARHAGVVDRSWQKPPAGFKAKDLIGIPWRVAFALQADGWYLRSDIIWAKPNPMPESVTDRPTKAHEYVFLLSKSARYFYDAAAICEPVAESQVGRVREDQVGGASHRERGQHSPGGVYKKSGNKARKMGDERGRPGPHIGGSIPWEGSTRNARTVWSITTQPYPEAHFATFPEELPRRCILAGSAPGDTVLDPFAGSGTTLAVAVGNGRLGIGCELNPNYAALARNRIGPMLCEVAA